MFKTYISNTPLRIAPALLPPTTYHCSFSAPLASLMYSSEITISTLSSLAPFLQKMSVPEAWEQFLHPRGLSDAQRCGSYSHRLRGCFALGARDDAWRQHYEGLLPGVLPGSTLSSLPFWYTRKGVRRKATRVIWLTEHCTQLYSRAVANTYAFMTNFLLLVLWSMSTV